MQCIQNGGEKVKGESKKNCRALKMMGRKLKEDQLKCRALKKVERRLKKNKKKKNAEH